MASGRHPTTPRPLLGTPDWIAGNRAAATWVLTPISDRAPKGRADFGCEKRGQRRGCGPIVDAIGRVKALPEANQSVLAVDLEHLCREPLPPVLEPDVVQRAHRIVRTRVVGLQLLEPAVPVGAHPSGKLRTSRCHG